ncbi:hypothetical protein B4145_4538 [Bacillus subtilis]|uniref:Holin-like toxin n=1 Tax=Bacillus subtilis subsp. subtilis TaxID=135461 RepID=A0ABD4A0G8_BACIU|nr:hypothetical protein B4067_4669 [Bacillus subtilis subsp. subtilis]KIN59296.1 hypothetical protein B4145_4538 [Bacillus subtilis]
MSRSQYFEGGYGMINILLGVMTVMAAVMTVFFIIFAMILIKEMKK